MARRCYECGQNNNENCLACNQNAIREIEYQKWLEKKRKEAKGK